MATITEQFRDEIAAYLRAAGMDPTTFGRRVMNDPRFVFDLAKGRSASSRTIDKVRQWMADNPPESRLPDEAA